MPDQSPAERECGHRRTLLQAVAYICAADRCGKDDAQQQLRKALAIGALGSLRWADARHDPPVCIPESADIDWEAGTVRDEWGETAPAPRVLLILSRELRAYWPEMRPRANRDDEDRYEAQQTRLMRGAREKREAADAAWQAAWNAEFAKPISQRQYFSFGEVAEELALDPTNYAVDDALRARIIEELTVRVRSQQFDLAGGEVATLSGDLPAFEPIQPIPPAAILIHAESFLLRRDACRRFVEKSLLPRAPSLLREWFPAEATTSKPRQRRQICEAIEVLATAPDWEDLQAEPRMRRIEERLKKPKFWCKARTYHRAMADYQTTHPTDLSATSATSATSTTGTSA